MHALQLARFTTTLVIIIESVFEWQKAIFIAVIRLHMCPNVLSVDLTPGIMGSSSGDFISSGDTVLVLADITLSCVVPGIPMNILPGASITWFGPGTEVESMNVGQSSLVLDMIDVQLDDAGTYTCRFTVASDLLEGGGLTVNQDFDLQVQRKARIKFSAGFFRQIFVVFIIILGSRLWFIWVP